MIEVRPLQDGDIDYVCSNPLEDAVKNYPPLKPDLKTSYTALWDGNIVGIGGINILWKGVGELWMILTKDSVRNGAHGITAFETIRKKMSEIIDNFDIKRAQAVVRIDFPQAIKMIEALGFEKEGLLRSYCPDGCSVYMYSKIRRPNGDER